jgi:hypothetical protein
MNVFLIALAGMLIVLQAGILQKHAAFVRLYTIPKRKI